MKNKIAIFGFTTLLAAAGAQSAQAGHVSFQIGASIGFPAPVCATPVYAPPPVHCAGPPAVVVARPRVVYSAPVAYAAPVGRRAVFYGAPGSVVYARPACAAPPPAYVAPVGYCITPPVFGFGFGFGHGYSHPHHK